MLLVVFAVSLVRAEPTPTEAWLHLEIGEEGPVRGRVVYAVDLDAETAALRLDVGPRVTVARASVAGEHAGGSPMAITPTEGAVTLTPLAPLLVGRVLLTLEFSAQVSAELHAGFFAVRSEPGPFLYSYFEPNHARDAFPCFDAPRFKPRWTVEVVAPSRFTVAANAPLSAVVSLARANRWEFEKSPPMPSYLVAVAAGPFHVRTVRNVGRSELNVRVLAPSYNAGAGIAPQVRAAVEHAEAWMDAALPWPKLDVVVTEAETWFGAMEHPGLILARREDDPGMAGAVLKHELLHFWFGNVVTPRTWADAWLSEGPAYWGAGAGPGDEAGAWLWDGGLGWGAPGPIHAAPSDLAASELTHRQQWGAGALLATLDTWRSLQPSAAPSLQAVLREYVGLRLGRHADTESFVTALSAAWPDLPVEAVLFGLLDEWDTPTVELGWACEGAGATLYLTQTRGLGRTDLPPLPLFLRAEGMPTFVVTVNDSLTVQLGTCPAWVLGNATGAGFYRVDYDAAARAALRTFAAEREITDRERFAVDAKP